MWQPLSFFALLAPVMKCALGSCTAALTPSDERVSLRVDPRKLSVVRQAVRKGAAAVSFDNRTGSASFHRCCWEQVRTGPPKTAAYGRALRDANETAEFFDSDRQVQRAVERCAALIRGAEGSTVAFTGAGISTSAGIGDYRGPHGKWTEMGLGIDGASAAVTPAEKEGAAEEVEGKIG